MTSPQVAIPAGASDLMTPALLFDSTIAKPELIALTDAFHTSL